MSGAGERLNELLAMAGQASLSVPQLSQFETYLSLLLRWNDRQNLTAIRNVDAILSRHFVESIACARALPQGIRTMLDFGSGAGFPGLPIAICRPEIAVTLAESQGKKAAFLMEAVRSLRLATDVWTGRAEGLDRQFDCVTLRAVDRMADAVAIATRLVASKGWLVLMTTVAELPALQAAASATVVWSPALTHLGGSTRVLALGLREPGA